MSCVACRCAAQMAHALTISVPQALNSAEPALAAVVRCSRTHQTLPHDDHEQVLAVFPHEPNKHTGDSRDALHYLRDALIKGVNTFLKPYSRPCVADMTKCDNSLQETMPFVVTDEHGRRVYMYTALLTVDLCLVVVTPLPYVQFVLETLRIVSKLYRQQELAASSCNNTGLETRVCASREFGASLDVGSSGEFTCSSDERLLSSSSVLVSGSARGASPDDSQFVWKCNSSFVENPRSYHPNPRQRCVSKSGMLQYSTKAHRRTSKLFGSSPALQQRSRTAEDTNDRNTDPELDLELDSDLEDFSDSDVDCEQAVAGCTDHVFGGSRVGCRSTTRVSHECTRSHSSHSRSVMNSLNQGDCFRAHGETSMSKDSLISNALTATDRHVDSLSSSPVAEVDASNELIQCNVATTAADPGIDAPPSTSVSRSSSSPTTPENYTTFLHGNVVIAKDCPNLCGTFRCGSMCDADSETTTKSMSASGIREAVHPECSDHAESSKLAEHDSICSRTLSSSKSAEDFGRNSGAGHDRESDALCRPCNSLQGTSLLVAPQRSAGNDSPLPCDGCRPDTFPPSDVSGSLSVPAEREYRTDLSPALTAQETLFIIVSALTPVVFPAHTNDDVAELLNSSGFCEYLTQRTWLQDFTSCHDRSCRFGAQSRASRGGTYAAGGSTTSELQQPISVSCNALVDNQKHSGKAYQEKGPLSDLSEDPAWARTIDFELTSLRYSDAASVLQGISPAVVVTALAALMQERRVAVVAKCESRVARVVLALTTILHPFTWPHMLVPSLSPSLVAYMAAPCPFLVGIREELLQDALEDQPPDDIVYIFLDEGGGTAKCTDSAGDPAKFLPRKVRNRLVRRLSKLRHLDVPHPSALEEVTPSNGRMLHGARTPTFDNTAQPDCLGRQEESFNSLFEMVVNAHARVPCPHKQFVSGDINCPRASQPAPASVMDALCSPTAQPASTVDVSISSDVAHKPVLDVPACLRCIRDTKVRAAFVLLRSRAARLCPDSSMQKLVFGWSPSTLCEFDKSDATAVKSRDPCRKRILLNAEDGDAAMFLHRSMAKFFSGLLHKCCSPSWNNVAIEDPSGVAPSSGPVFSRREMEHRDCVLSFTKTNMYMLWEEQADSQSPDFTFGMSPLSRSSSRLVKRSPFRDAAERLWTKRRQLPDNPSKFSAQSGIDQANDSQESGEQYVAKQNRDMKGVGGVIRSSISSFRLGGRKGAYVWVREEKRAPAYCSSREREQQFLCTPVDEEESIGASEDDDKCVYERRACEETVFAGCESGPESESEKVRHRNDIKLPLCPRASEHSNLECLDLARLVSSDVDIKRETRLHRGTENGGLQDTSEDVERVGVQDLTVNAFQSNDLSLPEVDPVSNLTDSAEDDVKITCGETKASENRRHRVKPRDIVWRKSGLFAGLQRKSYQKESAGACLEATSTPSLSAPELAGEVPTFEDDSLLFEEFVDAASSRRSWVPLPAKDGLERATSAPVSLKMFRYQDTCESDAVEDSASEKERVDGTPRAPTNWSLSIALGKGMRFRRSGNMPQSAPERTSRSKSRKVFSASTNQALAVSMASAGNSAGLEAKRYSSDRVEFCRRPLKPHANNRDKTWNGFAMQCSNNLTRERVSDTCSRV